MLTNLDISKAMSVKLDDSLPEKTEFAEGIRRASNRELVLNENEIGLALKNALRYIPEKWQEKLAPEFLEELINMGRIYGYRFRPKGRIYGKPIDEYKGHCLAGKAIQVMIDNNLDFEVALYPYELTTYGETGQVCQNWMQYCLIKKYLEALTENQTLVVESGHPLGLFKSSPEAPRVILTNGLLVGEFDNQKDWHKAISLGVTNYGQMTAGGWMYIGSQGIVHGTYSTLLNAGRLKLNIPDNGDLKGHLFVSSGLGGMSGAQGKAVEIAQGVCIIAEVDYSRIQTRLNQNWIKKIVKYPAEAFQLAQEYIDKKESISIGFFGNIIDLLEYAVEKNIKIDLLSDQTSCHVPYDGGYCPQGLTFEERTEMLKTDKAKFVQLVNRSLAHHFDLIKKLVDKNTFFFDYGNSFMKAIFDSGVKEICKDGKNTNNGFIFPSYVENIMGPLLFDYGYGPFRWVCLSGKHKDLLKTDQAAMECIDPEKRFQDRDNYNWIKNADKNQLVVGTQARILYQDAEGRIKIALKFNEMVRKGEISGPIMLGRDHHDPGGTDSPYRETANIKDGSNVTADMATQCFAGNIARGMTMVTLHNGGGVGIGKAINGGFGLVLDGSEKVNQIIKNAISWDVIGGVARRSWARNEHALETAAKHNMENKVGNQITLPYLVNKGLIKKTILNK